MPWKDPQKNRDSVKRHYYANPEYYREKNARARLRKADFLRKVREVPCSDCGTVFPYYVMEFDHIGDKQHDVARMTSATWTQIRAELEKCEVVCANCHKIRTYNRRIEDGRCQH